MHNIKWVPDCNVNQFVAMNIHKPKPNMSYYLVLNNDIFFGKKDIKAWNRCQYFPYKTDETSAIGQHQS